MFESCCLTDDDDGISFIYCHPFADQTFIGLNSWISLSRFQITCYMVPFS